MRGSRFITFFLKATYLNAFRTHLGFNEKLLTEVVTVKGVGSLVWIPILSLLTQTESKFLWN